MKSDIKIMLLGIAVMLLGFYIIIGLGLIGIIFPIIGIVLVLYGFFSGRQTENLDEKIYNILLKREIKEEKDLVCKKCGETYKEGYTACPWCGYKEE